MTIKRCLNLAHFGCLREFEWLNKVIQQCNTTYESHVALLDSCIPSNKMTPSHIIDELHINSNIVWDFCNKYKPRWKLLCGVSFKQNNVSLARKIWVFGNMEVSKHFSQHLVHNERNIQHIFDKFGVSCPLDAWMLYEVHVSDMSFLFKLCGNWN